MRCDCCNREARFLFRHAEPGTRYTLNDLPAAGSAVTACSRPCAVEAVYGPRRRVPAGHTLKQIATLGRR